MCVSFQPKELLKVYVNFSELTDNEPICSGRQSGKKMFKNFTPPRRQKLLWPHTVLQANCDRGRNVNFHPLTYIKIQHLRRHVARNRTVISKCLPFMEKTKNLEVG